MLTNPLLWIVTAIWLLPGIGLALPAHAMAHAFAAERLGDRSARNMGYLSLRLPKIYFSPYGTLMFLAWRAGWPQEGPVNEYRLRGVGAKLAYALAGPAANLVLALIFGAATRYAIALGGLPNPTQFYMGPISLLATLLYAIFFANLSAFAFNLLPVPNLDGWRVVEALFYSRNPRFFADVGYNRTQIVNVALIGLFISGFIGVNLLGWAMAPFYHPVSLLLFGTCVPYPFLNPCLPLGA